MVDAAEPLAPRKRARRERKTRRSVILAERVARLAISLGGGLTIGAVSLICVFLVWVVIPLFAPADLRAAGTLGAPPGASAVLYSRVDEYASMVWQLSADGRVRVQQTSDGALLDAFELLPGTKPAALAIDARSSTVACGGTDGTVRLATLRFEVDYLDDEEVSDQARALAQGQRLRSERGVLERISEGQLRRVQLSFALSEPFALRSDESASAPRLLDLNVTETGALVAALFEDGKLCLGAVKRIENMMTGEETLRFRGGELPYRPDPGGAEPMALRLLGNGDNVLVVWRDGRAVRFDARELAQSVEAEVLDFTPDPRAQITALDAILGERTLLVGDSLGNVSAWFRARPPDAGTVDGARMVKAHEFTEINSAVTCIAPSPASRTFGVGRADGSFELYFLTSEKLLASARLEGDGPLTALAIAPREDLVLAESASATQSFELVSPHPESSVASLLSPIWYENDNAPAHVWQSSSGADDFEAKFGLMPLIFGTLKATFYSLLFGVPLALLAAIYSSEFLAPRARVGVKSTIEIMASLPSVVLGFLAGNVIAPLVQGRLTAVLASFYVVPTVLLLGARLWQLVPQSWALRVSALQRFLLIALSIPLGLAVGSLLGPAVENAWFGGDFEGWLDRRHGDALPGWFLLLLPLAAITSTALMARTFERAIRDLTHDWSRARCAALDLARFAGTALGACALAYACGALLEGVGWDPRGAVVDTYSQRNALVVGFIMGFAIIPIIYTLAEDALASVPEQLRQASLGAGATPWQTALRVIVPTAASGLFSAVMVGLGRAVGETMIVLMAAGNTPVMQWNIFSGFRTLSANIAVELPEAVEGDTHYRTLFLAALALFAMTFVVNTAAEVVRQRFRRRAYQL